MTGTAAIASLALILHIFAAVVWVGGMFFALLVLRPASGLLEPGARLPLWEAVFARFFGWVIAAIVVLLASGYGMILGAGITGRHVEIMQGTGILMILLFLHLYFAPWRRFRAAVARHDLPAAAGQLNQIRLIVTVNLFLGLLTVAVGSGGRYWG